MKVLIHGINYSPAVASAGKRGQDGHGWQQQWSGGAGGGRAALLPGLAHKDWQVDGGERQEHISAATDDRAVLYSFTGNDMVSNEHTRAYTHSGPALLVGG
jgi:hypothetical protein